eukprot:CAMPEP_0174848248 /NCGR_PEP_ID=MMETSP1114-20130205/13411_1 /TAXON_ID=312471 /ORGANISM="Neobodo designis, Strain CCAP 1951/1" /LENGTH=74 /DNA_ID=CAMNT_0016082547 /DNA_START=53 /DNA_END=274 /DNA_ORIENTATION=+
MRPLEQLWAQENDTTVTSQAVENRCRQEQTTKHGSLAAAVEASKRRAFSSIFNASDDIAVACKELSLVCPISRT